MSDMSKAITMPEIRTEKLSNGHYVYVHGDGSEWFVDRGEMGGWTWSSEAVDEAGQPKEKGVRVSSRGVCIKLLALHLASQPASESSPAGAHEHGQAGVLKE